MDFEVHCMFILPTELSLLNYDKVKSVLQSVTPLRNSGMHANVSYMYVAHYKTLLACSIM